MEKLYYADKFMETSSMSVGSFSIFLFQKIMQEKSAVFTNILNYTKLPRIIFVPKCPNIPTTHIFTKRLEELWSKGICLEVIKKLCLEVLAQFESKNHKRRIGNIKLLELTQFYG